MGYAQYFSYDPVSAPFIAAWPRIREDAERILAHVEAAGVSLCRDPFAGTLPPEYEVIAFNGAPEELASQPLVIWLRWPGNTLRDSDGRVRGHCKTSRQPYDAAVAALLLRCHRLLPDEFAINSDGSWDVEWRHADRMPTPRSLSPRAVVAELFGDNAAECPFDPNWLQRRDGRPG